MDFGPSMISKYSTTVHIESGLLKDTAFTIRGKDNLALQKVSFVFCDLKPFSTDADWLYSKEGIFSFDLKCLPEISTSLTFLEQSGQ